MITGIEFSDDITELSYSEIAQALVEAVRKASAEITRNSMDLMAPLEAERAGIPKLTHLPEQLSIDSPGLQIPEPIATPFDLPKAGQRRQFADDSASPDADAESGRDGCDSITEPVDEAEVHQWLWTCPRTWNGWSTWNGRMAMKPRCGHGTKAPRVQCLDLFIEAVIGFVQFTSTRPSVRASRRCSSG